VSDWSHPVHQVAHLVKRFCWSLRAKPLASSDAVWVRSLLLTGEWELFERLPCTDQQHHLMVARRFIGRFELEPPRAWTAAALLHDIGKIDVGLGTFGRAAATLWLWGRDGDGRFGRYHQHVSRGAEMLVAAGSDEVTVALVGERPDAPVEAAKALRWADNL